MEYNSTVRKIINQQDNVILKFQDKFRSPTKLTKDDYLNFLNFKHNQHWSGLARSGQKAAENFNNLITQISNLTDESKDIVKRFNDAFNNLDGIGTGILSAILLVAYPDKYGAWNALSEKKMREYDLWPTFPSGVSIGRKYFEINKILLHMADTLHTDLWTLDALWGEDATPLKDSQYNKDWKISVATIANTAFNTTQNANGQTISSTIKNKDMYFSSQRELEQYIFTLLKKQQYRCSITGLKLDPTRQNPNICPSLDRIDSNGHYKKDNLQVVARFINKWKSSTPDTEFRHLIEIVRNNPTPL